MNFTPDYTRVALSIDPPFDTDYYSIGHGDRKGFNGYFLWLYQDGTIKVSESQENNAEDSNLRLRHTDLWSARDMVQSYHGRYDPGKKVISLISPIRSQHREIPNILISQLQQKFPEALKIVRFE
jgi:hypothetical protein